MHRLEFRAMGSSNLVLLDAEGDRRPRALDNIRRWFRTVERHLSRFIDDSELCRLNGSAGKPFRASRVLCDVLALAIEGARESGGLVAPTLLSELESAGYDRSFERVRRESVRARAVKVAPRARWTEIELDRARRFVRVPKGVRIDLGGFVKGWVADRAAERLAEIGPSLVEAGGDVAISGPRSDGSPWLVTIADPALSDGSGRVPIGQVLEMIHVERGGVATSGRDHRRWRRDGVWLHHILDPRTGRPAATDVLSVTVIAESAARAELAAKTLMILGSKKGLAWIERRDPLAAVIVNEDGTVLRSARLRGYLARRPLRRRRVR
jgi:FAD:protein FMN transferase